jgi:lysylphosphatidylglycerol synthetase-like protein (DUF2156 family)
MSTSTTPPVPVAVPPGQREIRVYSHSSLFYWWPVWAVGFIIAFLTFFDGHRMAIVPSGTKAEASRRVEGQSDAADVLIAPKGKTFPRDENNEILQPRLHMAQSKSYGVIYATILIITIVVSSVPLRGLWSLIIVLCVVLMVVIFALFGWWDQIIEKINLLDIRINMGGYLFISVILLLIWALTVFIFDHRTYVIVTTGQVRLCQAVGAGETVYDTTGMTFSKQQNDLFRHWIVGLGSGDLIIHRSNTNQEIDMPNVLFIAAKVRQIEQLIKERQVV